MSQIIDRRLNGKNKSTVNRARFIERYKNQIKKAVSDAIGKRSIKDMERGESISIPSKDISEPIFHHGKGGIREGVHPGNKEFTRGDQFERPQGSQGGGGQGSEASDSGEGEDDFVFELSREEFLDLYFEDLSLPDMLKKEMSKISEVQNVRAGHTTVGVPTNLDIPRSFRNAMARRIALTATMKKQLLELQKEKKEAEEKNLENTSEIDETIVRLEKRIKKIPFIDDIDLRYHNRVKRYVPSTQAVMFCVMDVSGSMDEAKKDIAKRFFILLYLFLKKNYDKIELVFIRHHTSAKEVNEEEFFYSRETGGTVVSSALDLTSEIMQSRYPSSAWNIYVAQASDGDNWNADSPRCKEILIEQIVPFVQYYAYVEIMPRHHQSLWESYTQVAERFPRFAMQTIDTVSDIYPVFRDLFKRSAA